MHANSPKNELFQTKVYSGVLQVSPVVAEVFKIVNVSSLKFNCKILVHGSIY